MKSIWGKIRGIIEKYRQFDGKSIDVINNIFGTVIVNFISMLVAFFSIPLYISYFNDNEILGFWFTLLAVLSWIMNFDMGIGNGLRNYLTKLLALNDFNLSKKYISTSYIFILFISVILGAILSVLVKYVNWNSLFNMSPDYISPEKLQYAVGIILGGLIIQFFLRLISSILYAMQKTFINNLIVLLGNVFMLLFVIYFKSSDAPVVEKFINLAWFRVFAVNLPFVVATLVVFTTSLKKCRPNWLYFDRKIIWQVFSLGGAFLIAQLLTMVLSTSNEFLITKLVNSSFVVNYQIYNKIFFLIASIITLSLHPLWSAITKAIAQNDRVWIESLFSKVQKAALLATLLLFMIIPFMQWIINLWLRQNAIQINYQYAVIFALSGGIFIWSGIFAVFVAGFGKLKLNILILFIAVVVKIVMAIVLVHLGCSWIAIIIAHVCATLIYPIVMPVYIKKLISQVS